MRLLDRIEQMLIWWSCLGRIGSSFVGRILAPLIMIPLLFAGRFVATFSCDLFYILFIGMVVKGAIGAYLALRSMPLERAHEIVLPRVLGMGIAFFFIPLTMSMILWGFGVYTIILLIAPKLLQRWFAVDGVQDHLPFAGPLGMFTNEVFSGAVTCAVLHIMQLAGVQ
jgi:hypothetical protein